MKKSKKIILTISAVTLTAGVLLTGIGYMKAVGLDSSSLTANLSLLTV